MSASALTGYHVREWRDRAGNVVGDGDRYTPTRNEGALWEECRFVAIIEPNAYRIAYEPGEGTGAMADS